MKKYVIIVAGGKGLRMGSDLPKQFIPIGGKPILMRTLESFYNADNATNIVLVIPASHRDYWAKLCVDYQFVIPHVITLGGETRFHSVQNGLALVGDGIVAIHDGARPFASQSLIRDCFEKAKNNKAVIPVIDCTDSLREITDSEHSHIIDRSKIKMVQTPQVFHTDVLKNAYKVIYSESFTDDASVVEAMGVNIHLVKGEVTNIKVTTPLDLKIAEIIAIM